MKTVRLFAGLRRIAGAKTMEVSLEADATVRDLIQAIGAISPELHAQLLNDEDGLSSTIHVMINGRHATLLNGLDTVIPDDAEIALIPQMAGG